MKKFQINLPAQTDTDEFEVRMLVACGLFEKGKLSAGQAAEMVGITKAEFLEKLSNYGHSTYGYNSMELREDIAGYGKWEKS